MSTLTTPSAASTPAGTTAAGPPARFWDLVAAEWIKLRSLRSTKWTLLLITAMVVGSAAIAALADYDNFPRYPLADQLEHPFSLRDAFPQPGWMTLMLAAGSIGAIAVVSEHSSGLIRTTTAAVPARGSVMLAKAIVLAALWTVIGALITTLSFLVSQAILSGRHAAVSFSDPYVTRAFVASALVAPVCALIGMGLGALIRHSASTIVATAVTLLMLPLFFSNDKRWSADLNHSMVQVAWRRLTQPWGPLPGDSFHQATITGSWVVFAVWPIVAVILALLVVRHRDV